MPETNVTTNNIDKMLTKFGHTSDAIDVQVQSSTNQLFTFLLMQNTQTGITLTSPIAVDDEVIDVSAGHGFVAATGEYVYVRSGDIFIQMKVVSVASNAITVEMPVDMPFPLDATVIRGNIGMNVNGLASPTKFEFTLDSASGAITPIDISTIVITMQHGTNVPDDGKFGGLGALLKGMYFRKINGVKTNLGNYQTNQDFKRVGGAVEYTSKAPSGTNGTNIMFEIEKTFGQIIRLDPKSDDGIESLVRDNINATAGMAWMTVTLIGSFTSGE